jgi:transposase
LECYENPWLDFCFETCDEHVSIHQSPSTRKFDYSNDCLFKKLPGFRQSLAQDSPKLLELKERHQDNEYVQAVTTTLETLDCTPLEDAYRGCGSLPYCPVSMLAIALYCILDGKRSPSEWWKASRESEPCRLLGCGIEPARSTWYGFRDRASKFIDSIHRQIVEQAINEGLVEAIGGCLDGTFVDASASRHKRFDLTKISSRLNVLKRAIAQADKMLQVAAKKPLLVMPYWLAKTPAGRQRQLEQYRMAKRQILKEIQENRELPASLKRIEEAVTISPADPDAVIGRDKKRTTRPLYNVQYMTDYDVDFILAYGVFQKKNDTGALVPMIQLTQELVSNRLKRVHADAGYCSLLELIDSKQEQIELFAPVPSRTGSKKRPTESGKEQLGQDHFIWDKISQNLTCPSGHSMKLVSRSKDPRADNRFVIELRYEQSEALCQACPLKDACLSKDSRRRTARRLEDQSMLDEQVKRMKSPEGQASQKRRREMVERMHGDSKTHRDGEAFCGRGLTRAAAETGMMVVAQNCFLLQKLRKAAENKQI